MIGTATVACPAEIVRECFQTPFNGGLRLTFQGEINRYLIREFIRSGVGPARPTVGAMNAKLIPARSIVLRSDCVFIA